MDLKKALAWNEYVELALSYAVFTQDEDSTWTVEVPLLPGCVTWGRTRAEAISMVRDAIEGWLITAIRFGDEIPIIDGCILANMDDRMAQEVADVTA